MYDLAAMARRQSRDEWLHDIQARQRNLVFPDTASNEARFWRNIIDGTRRLTAVQIIGVCIFGAGVIAMAFYITFLRDVPSAGFSWQNFAAGIIDWVIGFGILGIFLWFFRRSDRRT